VADVLLWAFEHGITLGWVSLVLALLVVLPLALLSVAVRWYLFGAKAIAAGWIWREAWRALRRHRGGAGGHSPEYEAYMSSSEWRRRRAQILRRAGRRCGCGRRASDVHHKWYGRPLGSEPDAALVALCPDCHRRAHGR
jgi:hypothetical protein